MTKLSDRIFSARMKSGLTQHQLAEKAGCSQGLIGNLEAGIQKSSTKIIYIAAALEVDPVWLQMGDGEGK